MPEHIQLLLESSLPALHHHLHTHIITRPQLTKIIDKRRQLLHRPFTLDNAIRLLEYESKLDRYLRRKGAHNTFLITMYKRSVVKFRNERLFTMFVHHLTSHGSADDHTYHTLSTFCMVYLRRNRTDYLTLLMAHAFYRMRDVSRGREVLMDGMRSGQRGRMAKMARMMRMCEKKYVIGNDIQTISR